jgi:tRNA A-37 threonylcarbamoyl transferase component Bud32
MEMISNYFDHRRIGDDVIYQGDFAIRYDSRIELCIAKNFLSAPDQIFESGKIISSAWKNPAIEKSVVKMGNGLFFIKRYNCLGKIYKIKNMYRRSKALKSWWAGWALLDVGISTPRPVICLEERRFRLLGASYLFCEFINDARNLLEAWPSLDDQKRVQLLCLAGFEIGKMHRTGLLHGDLNWRNVLIQEQDHCGKIFLVDLDGSYYAKHIKEATARRDLNHFYRDLDRQNAHNKHIEVFTKSWQRAFCPSE